MDRNTSDFIRYLEHEFGGNEFLQEAGDRLNAQRSKAVNRSLSLARADDLTSGSVAMVICRGCPFADPNSRISC